MIEDFFDSLKVGIAVGIIGFIVLIVIIIATKGREWVHDKADEKKRKAKIAYGIQIMSDIVPKLQPKGLYSYWEEIEQNIRYLKKSQAKSEPPYKFEAMLMVYTFSDNGPDTITMTIESGYTMLNIIENELNKRGLKSPRQ